MSTRLTDGCAATLLVAALSTTVTMAEAAPSARQGRTTVTGLAGADDDASSSKTAGPLSATERRARAREAFAEGTSLVRKAMWGQALVEFEEAHRLVPHAITLYNMGVCERALGRYTSARRTLERALAVHAEGETKLPERLFEDTKGYLSEMDGIISKVRITVRPRGARVVIDGRPLLATERARKGAPIFVAGVSPPGPGNALALDTLELELDPGRHVITFSRPGFSDAIVRRDFASGDNPSMELTLDRLPATIRVKGDVPGALVTLDGKDLGPVPVTVRRPAGSYRLLVQADGYEDYESNINVKPGQEASLTAKLPVDEPLIVERWWFWTAAAAVVAGAAVGTYFLVRDTPDPERQAVNGGSLNWSIPIP